ncbi:MAG: TerD family protein [Alphaproteobacteria bacterium]
MVDIFDPAYDKKVEIKVSDNKVNKGDDINLTAKDPTMNNIVVGVGWTLNAFDADTLDLDICCFLLNKDGKTRVDEDFVFYNNVEACDGAVCHNGDNLTGAGDGDDETISIDLSGVPFDIVKIMFVFSIYKGEEKGQGMGSVRNGYLRVVNASNSQEILRYDVQEEVEGHSETAMLIASINREGPKWHFEAVGEFVEGGLGKVATDYDIIVHQG